MANEDLIKKVTLPSGTTYNIANAPYYCTCATTAATVAKVASCDALPDMTGQDPWTGMCVVVKFTYVQTASNPTISVNGSTAKLLKQYGTTAIGADQATDGWRAGAIVMFTYDGTNWVRDQGYNTNTNTLVTVYRSTTDVDLPILMGNTSGATAAWSAPSSGSYKSTYGSVPNTSAPTINSSTGAMAVPGSLTVGGYDVLTESDVTAYTAAEVTTACSSAWS